MVSSSGTKMLTEEQPLSMIECARVGGGGERDGYEVLLPKTLNSKPMEVIECHVIEGQQRWDKRPTWGRGIEFLMSCLSLSVGLGNIWRFPYACHENGGAIFVIPYLIILLFIGKPFYFLEMILGQFTSKGSMKAIEVIPLMKGIGWGQQIASATITTYYTAIVGLCLSYLVSSFTWNSLPWATCSSNSSESCYPAENLYKYPLNDSKTSSAALFFSVETLHMKSDISNGIGTIVVKLAICLLISWICVYVSIIRGIKTSGKLAYFFAITPYIILIAILSFACTLEGALDGILYFINPGNAWEKLWDAKVWYHACTQCFFSLTIGMGCIIMFSSYNKFSHNIYRDATIVSVMDTLTSMLGGLTIYAILGNLSANSGKNIKDVVSDSFGLAFITYPEAIAKIKTAMNSANNILPQILSITFFAMLFVLGVGSTVGLMNNISTNLKDYFPKVKYWLFAFVCSVAGCMIGMLYVTEGGIHVLGLVDHFGGEFLIFTLATAELISIVWIYGLQNICWDVEFMLKRKLSTYWRVCWAVIMPCFMLVISAFFVTKMENPKYNSNTKEYPFLALFGGWTLFAIGCSQIFLCTFYLYLTKSKTADSFWNYLISPNVNWGPKSVYIRKEWEQFKSERRQHQQLTIEREEHSWLRQKWWELVGKY